MHATQVLGHWGWGNLPCRAPASITRTQPKCRRCPPRHASAHLQCSWAYTRWNLWQARASALAPAMLIETHRITHPATQALLHSDSEVIAACTCHTMQFCCSQQTAQGRPGTHLGGRVHARVAQHHVRPCAGPGPLERVHVGVAGELDARAARDVLADGPQRRVAGRAGEGPLQHLCLHACGLAWVSAGVALTIMNIIQMHTPCHAFDVQRAG